jgi:hypothetical protein
MCAFILFKFTPQFHMTTSQKIVSEYLLDNNCVILLLVS